VGAASNIGIGVASALRPRLPAGTEVRIVDEVDELASAWDDLAGRTGASPFAHPGWLLAWSEAYSRPERLRIVSVWRENDLVAVLPVDIRGRSAFSPTNWHTPAFTAVAADAGATQVAVGGLLAAYGRRVRLSFVPDGDPMMDTLFSPMGHHVSRRVLQRSPHVAVEGPWDAYLAGRSANLRSDVRRRLRRIEELGPVRLDVSDGTTALGSLLDEGLRLEGSGWKEDAGTAIASSESTRRFYSNIASWAAPRGWLSLAFLRVGERAVAFQYGIVANNTYHFLKGGYDPGLRSCSPGKVLHALMIERTFDEGLSRYDFLGGEEPYKTAWSSGGTDLLEVNVASGAMGRIVHGHGRALARDVVSHGSRLGSALRRRVASERPQ